MIEWPFGVLWPFFRQNFEGGGGFAKSGLPTKSIPPSTCGKTPIETYHQLSGLSVLTITPQSYTSQNLICIRTYSPIYFAPIVMLFSCGITHHGMIRLDNLVLLCDVIKKVAAVCNKCRIIAICDME